MPPNRLRDRPVDRDRPRMLAPASGAAGSSGPRPSRRPKRTDPFLPYLCERLRAFPGLTAVRLWRELRERGYAGGYTAVKRAVRDMAAIPAHHEQALAWGVARPQNQKFIDKISCEYQLRERSVNKYLRWHDQITRSRGPKRNVTLLATRLSLDSSSLIDTSSLKDHLYVPQPTPKPTRWQPKGSSVFESTGRAR